MRLVNAAEASPHATFYKLNTGYMECLTLSNVNCHHAKLHNYSGNAKVCFVLIHLVFVLSKILAKIGDWE